MGIYRSHRANGNAPQFQAAADFHEGLARVYVWEKLACTSGEEYTKDNAPEYMFYLPGGGAMESCFKQDAHFGFIDKTAAFVVPARFFWLEDLSDGLAVARVDRDRGTKFGYIDRTGTFVVSPRFNQANSFSEGLAGVEVSSGIEGHQWGFIDKSGRMVIPPVYQFVGQFSEGLARVAVVIARQEGYVNRDGKMVIAPRFFETLDFSEGMSTACDRSGCSYINHDGEIALRVKGAFWPFSDGLTVVPLNGSGQRYIDSRGRIVARYN